MDSLSLSLAPVKGSEALRNAVAALYDESITPEHVITTVGATGANSLVVQGILKPGDHVISLYPSYAQLISLPQAITGVDVPLWTLDLENQAEVNIRSLEDLIKPTTKMVILNNPNNPTGTVLPPEIQRGIVDLAKSRGLFVVVDEIFRPLFHDPNSVLPPSFVEFSNAYSKILVTGSLSKAWGLTGVRAGWIVTTDPELLNECQKLKLYTINSTSAIDEVVAAEALSDRCRPQILSKHLGLAQQNLDLLQSFIDRHPKSCSWVRPSAGATAFVRFSVNGAAVDDVDFCTRLVDKTGVLLAPGTLCFGLSGRDDLRGYTRVHITGQPDVMRAALEALDDFLRYYP